MPSRILLAAERLILTRLAMGFSRATAASLMGERTMASDSDMSMLAVAALLGQLEGRPMNTSKLAAYVGIPRATAIRKLHALEARGIVAIRKAGVTIPLKRINHPLIVEIARGQIVRVKHAAAELSKLDTKPT